MEVATTNNHHHHHHHHHHHNQSHLHAPAQHVVPATAAATTIAAKPRSPFQREVREWQRIDPDTGALLTGRLEADRWQGGIGPLNSSYGKKSSSSISSTNSGSNNSIAATASSSSIPATTMNSNSYNSASKMSLHAIVGNNNNDTRLSTTSAVRAPTTTSATAAAKTTLWQRHSRHFEQPTLYGNSSNSLAKSRVGVNNCERVSSSSGGGGAQAGDATDDLRQRSDICDNHSDDDDGDDDELTPTQLNRQRRCDLESFRHYNKHAIAPSATAPNGDNEADDDDDLRFGSTRYQQRQQQPLGGTLQRSRSISTDDLSTEWNAHGEASEEPGEWRRVSKLRRSFQSNSTTNEAYNTSVAATTRRPLDLPSSTVSVSRIRAELEAGRRLNTAMRNNHVDLAALDNILNAPSGVLVKPAQTKRNTFLTAESLKEIRGRLKKLSDESLYKEDFLAYQQLPAAEEQIEVPHVKVLPERLTRLRQLTPEQSAPKSAFQAVTRTPAPTFSPVSNYATQCASPASNGAPKHTTNSLESRQKYKDTSSTEWHIRRKSYGFEKMSPPDDKSMFRMDASTDSGLGRSGELGNWSPTDSTPATRGTVIHFGEPAQLVQNTIAARKRYRALNSPGDSSSANDAEDMLKRHSIAVDESQYVRDNLRKTSQVHLNGFYDADPAKSLQTETTMTTSTLFQRTQQKRVEFCKTEVHFAAESGRVNIVETDGKPPPTNNFRRRRRTSSGPLQSLVKSAPTVSSSSAISENSVAMPITHFGDDHRGTTIASSVVAYKASLVDAQDMLEPTNVTVSIPKLSDAYAHVESSRNSYASTSGVDTDETDEISAIRGILKNKPIKPKPYHLGENIENADALWGVQLKPIGGTSLVGRGESAVQLDSPVSGTVLTKTVAERVRIVEKRQDLNDSLNSNGYSTKIKLSLDETPKEWTEELPKSNVMSIELRSPQERPNSAPKHAQTPPMAKPRTLANIKQNELVATSMQQPSNNLPKDSLKIIKEARGARKLREHELSYFGVRVGRGEIINQDAKALHFSTPKRSLPQRNKLVQHEHAQTKLNDTSKNAEKQTTKWQLLNDKPDLLRHSPIAVEPQVVTRTAEIKPMERKSLCQTRKSHNSIDEQQHETAEEDEEDEEHFYENISHDITPVFKVKSPPAHSYDRKMDLKRDAQILSEMTRNADQTMKALSDEAAIKDQRRRSLQRRNSKPLETIDEKAIAEKITDTCIAVKVSRSTLASEAKRSSRHSTPSPTTVASRTRTSSQSSVESCPRARSRSLSSEREEDTMKARPTVRTSATARHSASTKHAKPSDSRSSSLDSQRSAYSSGEEERYRREERLRNATKSRRSASASAGREKHERPEKTTNERHDGERPQRGSTTHSSQRERVECSKPQQHHHHHQEHRSSSSRRHRDGETSRSVVPSAHAGERKERASTHHDGSSSAKRLVRSTRAHEHDATALRSSSHRSERGEKVDKEKLSRSKGHSSRSTTQNSSERHHSASQSAASPIKPREHKKSTATSSANETKQRREHDKNTIHSKNAPTLNGHHVERVEHHAKHQHHAHPVKTSAITSKSRERSRKDRK